MNKCSLPCFHDSIWVGSKPSQLLRGLAHFLEISGIEKENKDMPLFPTPPSNYIDKLRR